MTIYETHSEVVAEFDSLMEQLDLADDREPVLGFAKRLIRIAERLVVEAPKDADTHHLVGLAWYHFPGGSAWRSWHCRAALEKALSIDPDHLWARKFLGYHLFDQEHYSEALNHFEKLGHDFFNNPDREWEFLKIRELSLVCKISLNPNELPKDFTDFCVSYIDARTREDESVELGSAVPLMELPQCAEWLLEHGADPKSAPLREILDFLGRYSSEISFWNKAIESELPETE